MEVTRTPGAVKSLYREPEQPLAEIEWPALECHDVFKIFRSGPTETVALRGLDLRVERGEFVAVLGPSGSGKSTLLHLAAGLEQPSAGEIRAFGRSLGMLTDHELAGYRARDVALVLQSGNLWSDLTAAENVAVSLRLAGSRSAGQCDARQALTIFGLGDRGSARVRELSGGEQQRVAIAAAAARAAPIVLADEPTGELDAVNEELVVNALLRLRDQFASTVVVVTHSARLADAADRVVELRDGRTDRA